MSDVRVYDWEAFREDIRELADAPEERYHFIVGEVAPKREFAEMVEEFEAFDEEPHSCVDDPSLERDGELIRYGDYIVPADGINAHYADDVVVHKSLAGLHAGAESVLKTEHPNVHSDAQIIRWTHDLEDDLGSDVVLLSGAFQPDGTYQITNDGPECRIGATRFQASVFSEGSIQAGPGKLSQYLAGTLVLPRAQVTDDVLRHLEDYDDVEEVTA